jgi:hypothetical protein
MTQHCLSDGKEIFRLANDPSIAPNLGVTPENPMTLEVAEGLVRGNMVNASAWPMWGEWTCRLLARRTAIRESYRC